MAGPGLTAEAGLCHHHLAIRKRGCVAAAVSIASTVAGWMRSSSGCPNILVPLPMNTGTRRIELSSTSPAPIDCCPTSAPLTSTSFRRRLLRFGVGDDEHRKASLAHRAVRTPPRRRKDAIVAALLTY